MIEGQVGVTWEQWVALARACEDHGIPALFRSDHYMYLSGHSPGHPSLDAWGTVNALAAITTSLRLGTLVSPATFRHPSNLAKLVTTADQISGGRVDLGLGAGWHEREHEAYGFPFPPTRVRMDILEEQLQVVLGNWQQEPFSFEGAHYKLDDLEAQPKPVQQPHPPLIMGGSAGPRSASLAARYADEYNTPFPTVDLVPEYRARVADACDRAGRDPIPFSAMLCVVLGADAADVSARVRQTAEIRGFDPAATLAERPAGWVYGTPDEVVEQLLGFREAGLSRVMCQHLLHEDLETIALLGEVIAPRVK